MIILGLETATGTASVGLLGPEEREVTRPCDRTMSRDLLGIVDETLAAARCARQDLEAIAVSIGPGSFTGLRIGLATAQGLALGLSLPVIPVPTMEALALQACPSPHPLMILQRARRTESYLAGFDVTGDSPRKTVPEKVIANNMLAKELTRPAVLAGNAVQACLDASGDEPDRALILENGTAAQPSGLAVARLALPLAGKASLDRNGSLEPYYFKDPDAKKMGEK